MLAILSAVLADAVPILITCTVRSAPVHTKDGDPGKDTSLHNLLLSMPTNAEHPGSEWLLYARLGSKTLSQAALLCLL